jgi:hypothetical protein
MGEWGGVFGAQQQTELGVGNQLLLAEDKLEASHRSELRQTEK